MIAAGGHHQDLTVGWRKQLFVLLVLLVLLLASNHAGRPAQYLEKKIRNHTTPFHS
jgi:hypothetical protein